MAKDCKFCSDYEYGKKSAKMLKSANVNTYLKVAICEESYRNRIRRGQHIYRARELNYCPTCGKRLRKERVHDNQNDRLQV